jgi:hypothetical protein
VADVLNLKSDSFWKVVPADDVKPNPLGYWCWPNACDPSYASARLIEDFVAYGLWRCFIEPDEFTLWHLMRQGDVEWLREYFLRALEFAALSVYDGTIVPGEWDADDAGDAFDSLTIGNTEEGDEDEFTFTWVVGRVDEDAVMVVQRWSDGDDVTIWLALSALSDMRRVRAAIALARRANGEPGQDWTDAAWNKLGVPNVEPEYQEYLKTDGKPDRFTEWYDRKFGRNPDEHRWTPPEVDYDGESIDDE